MQVSPCNDRTVLVDVVVRSDDPIRLQAVDMAFGWNPKDLRLVGISTDNATVPNLIVDIPQIPWDFYGINEQDPPADGDGYFMWLSPLCGCATMIDTDVLGTLVFERISDRISDVYVIPTAGPLYPMDTTVYASEIPGLNMTGNFFGCTVGNCIDFITK